jgi:hypothetical protein
LIHIKLHDKLAELFPGTRHKAELKIHTSIRNLAISILRLHGFKNIAASLRKLGWNSELALSLIGV